jgi:FHS family L-fucose permease-like MFS transporter
MTLMSKKKLASLGHANYILRHYGYKATFIWGLCLYGIGSLVGEQ